mgnify:CR=1 FL=1
MKLEIITEEFDVKSRLEQLNLSDDALKDAINHGYLSRTRLTSNHPRIYFGYSTWAETIARLREVLLPLGWEKSDKANYELVIHTQKELAIAVATGDESTGVKNATPSNKCPKGTNTIQAINTNNQLDLFQELIPTPTIDQENFSTWILLHHITEKEIRYELSLPYSIEVNGKITSWKERIILNPIQLDDELEIIPTKSQDIDIPIKRKAS